MIWKATLFDGTEVVESDTIGTGVLKPGTVEYFLLIGDDVASYFIILEPSQRLLYRHRVALDTGTGSKAFESWIVGYNEINDPTKGELTTLYQDGREEPTPLTDIELFPHEK